MWSGSTSGRVTKVDRSFLRPGHGRTCRIVLSKGSGQYFKLQEEGEQRLAEKKGQAGLCNCLSPKVAGPHRALAERAPRKRENDIAEIGRWDLAID